jgi:ankyrin repeat protein
MKNVQACVVVAFLVSLLVSQAFASPLADAISRGDLEGVVANAKKEAINAKDDSGATALHEASYRGYADIAKYLLDKGADISVKNAPGLTPLHYAAMNYFSRYSNLDIVVMLIEKGADINAKGTNGDVPIYIPAFNCNYDMVRLLIEKGADVNAKNDKGETPLHATSGNGNFECVNLLLANGADAKAKTNDGKTASDLARDHGHTELAEGLDEYMKRP